MYSQGCNEPAARLGSISVRIDPGEGVVAQTLRLYDQHDFGYEQFREGIVTILSECTCSDDARRLLRLRDPSITEALKQEFDDGIWESSTNSQESIWAVSVIADSPVNARPSGSSGVGRIVSQIRRRKLTRPVPDGTVESCYKCRSGFTLLTRRRHHCRACGRIFCYECSGKYAKVPDELVTYHDSGWFTGSTIESVRVCDDCFEHIAEYNTLTEELRFFRLLALPLDLCYRAATLTLKWRKALIYYLTEIRNIQYSLPNSSLKPHEAEFIRNNVDVLSTHSVWLLSAFKIPDLKIDLRITPTGRQCTRTLCSRVCHQHLDVFDAAVIIANSNVYTGEAIATAVTILSTATDQELSLVMPIIQTKIGLHTSLTDLLIKWAGRSKDVFNHLYWTLGSDNRPRSDKYKIRVITANPGLADKFSDIVEFHEELKDNYSDPQRLAETLIRDGHNLINPVDLNTMIREITKVETKSTATAPVVITTDVGRIMFKREDVRKDYYTLAVVKLMHNLVKNSGLPEVDLVTYNVVPTTPTTGFIQMVEKADTLGNILRQGKTISNQLHQNNENATFGAIHQRYTNTLAFWTVVTYLLGVGDRHHDNIMMTTDGRIFHIDYGYVLGHDAKPLVPSIRMDYNLIEGMGGSANYELRFKELCSLYFVELRKYAPLIFSAMLCFANVKPPIVGYKFTEEYIRSHVVDRFLLGQTEDEAKDSIMTLIEFSKDSFARVISDTVHTLATTVSPLWSLGSWFRS